MIEFASGNLLEFDAQALVNTVNTVGVMGKGVALMFKEAFPENFRSYVAACEANEVVVGEMFVTRRHALHGPAWIINFPTKKHWRNPSKIEWIEAGLRDLRRVVVENEIRSIALPPLGAGNGGLAWSDVRPKIIDTLKDLPDVRVTIFEPTSVYQNRSKEVGTEKLTPARALIAELIRRYWIIGFQCSILETQKLAWFAETSINDLGLPDPFDFKFEANIFGPYADRLRHLLNSIDGSFVHATRRISDADPLDIIWFDDGRKLELDAYLRSSEAAPYRTALDKTSSLVDGFESPFGLELLATVDWLRRRKGRPSDVASIMAAIGKWPAGSSTAKRKSKLFNERQIGLALDRLQSLAPITTRSSSTRLPRVPER